MSKDNIYIEAYIKYRKELSESDLSKELQIIAYDTIKTPENNDGIIWIYSEMLSEHTRQLANDINCFIRNLIKLDAWNKVICKYNENEKFNLMVEFIESLIILLHDYPSSIRDRFIFSLSHLCHQANRYTMSDWKDNLSDDQYIKQKDIKKCSSWKYFEEFKLKLSNIFGDDYNVETKNYRNMNHHRIPINTEIGLSNMVIRQKNDNNHVSYSFGFIEPLSLDQTIQIMKKQYFVIYECFSEYENLLKNQVNIIDKKIDDKC